MLHDCTVEQQFKYDSSVYSKHLKVASSAQEQILQQHINIFIGIYFSFYLIAEVEIVCVRSRQSPFIFKSDSLGPV